MSERDAIVAVTEADREAYLSLNMLPELEAADVRAGRWDKLTGLQVMARHRATHAAEVERLREALRAIQMEAERENGGWVHLKRVIAVIARQAMIDASPIDTYEMELIDTSFGVGEG